MKLTYRPWLTAAVMSVLAVSAIAQSAPGAPSPQSAHTDKMHERMGERHSKHLNALKAKLQLESGQEAAWSAFAQAMQPPAKPVPRPNRAALAKLSTPERIDQMQAFKTQVDAQMQKRADATKAFYAELNADQKKTFDAETARHMARSHAYPHTHPMGQGMHLGHAMPH